MTSPYPAAVLWDMDGTIVDTEPVWIEAEKRLVRRHGGVWTDADALALVGSDLLAAGEHIRRKTDLPMTAEQVRDQLMGDVLAEVKAGVTWRPGARELLAELDAAGVPCALVTMSYQVIADAVVAQLPVGAFEVTIPGDAVTHGKPHPEPYLAAASELQVEPADCLVIEDSPTGATSGLAAGMRVLGVPNAAALTPTPGLVVIDSLAGMRAENLLAAFSPG